MADLRAQRGKELDVQGRLYKFNASNNRAVGGDAAGQTERLVSVAGAESAGSSDRKGVARFLDSWKGKREPAGCGREGGAAWEGRRSRGESRAVRT